MIICQVPLRVSLLGGGTDLPEWNNTHHGCVVTSSIDKYVYIVLSKRFDDKIVVGYSKQEIVDKIEDLEHELVRETAIFTHMSKGFEVKTMADIPSGGTGLGSSSALLVGLLKIFTESNSDNLTLTQPELASAAYKIERHTLGKPVGMQDQLIAALGGQARFKMFEGQFNYEPIQIPDENLYLFYTGVTRKSSTILQEQTKNIDENLYERLANLALNYTPEDLPDLLEENWNIKKKLASGITTPEIDIMIELAKSGGAKASKILGAGGGGFLLVYATLDKITSVREKLKDYRELPFKFVKHGARIIFNNE